MGLQLTEVPPLEEGCPWSDWARPNLKWCENNLCSWITTPANTWSNLGYLVFAYIIYKEIKREGSVLGLFPIALFFTGATSFAYHASYTYFYQVFDFAGMFCFMCLSISLNCRRMHLVQSSSTTRKLYYTLVLLTSFIGIPLCEKVLEFPIQNTMFFLVGIQIFQELYLWCIVYPKEPFKKPSLRQFWTAIFFIICAFICSMLDLSRRWCDPDNHIIQGHAVWHILSAVGLFFVYKYYSQFAFEKDETGKRDIPI